MKKVKENWLGFILGVVLTCTVGPQAGLPVLQKALQDEAVKEAPATPVEVPEPDKSLTDSAPAVIINNERKKETEEVDNEK